jgi:crotonobetainyl-CoA:carnitine CoA-transferase CaiB-like acyl-CoA transferase
MGTPCQVAGPAPRLGEHNSTFLDGLPVRVAPAANHRDETRALAGLRVIEITANWAGPIAGRHLGDLGADVIKIELQTKPATRANM